MHLRRLDIKGNTYMAAIPQEEIYKYIDSCTGILYYCTQLVPKAATSVYTAIQLEANYTHIVVHTLCMDQLYCCTFIL